MSNLQLTKQLPKQRIPDVKRFQGCNIGYGLLELTVVLIYNFVRTMKPYFQKITVSLHNNHLKLYFWTYVKEHPVSSGLRQYISESLNYLIPKN